MKAITHHIDHHLQPTNTSCGYTALATLLSFYEVSAPPEQLLAEISQPLNESGDPIGSITTQLVTWCLGNGFSSHLYSFDCQILDLSWVSLSQNELSSKCREATAYRDAPGMGKLWSRIYLESYAEMLESGGELTILPYVTSELLNKLLLKAPVYANVCANVLNNNGRQRTIGNLKSISDDEKGKLSTHSIVIYGHDGVNSYLVSDPWDGLRTIESEHMLCSIMAAQIECDNMIFQISVTS